MAFCKYYKEEEYVSYDGGVSWTAMGVYRKGDLIEYGSSDCPDTSYVFNTSGLTSYTYTTDSESKVGVVFNITSTYEGVYQDFTVACGCGTDFLTVTKGSGNITINITENVTTSERYCPITLTQNGSGNQIIIVIDQTNSYSPTSAYTIPYTASSKLNVTLSAFTPAATAETYDSTAMTGQVEFSSAVTSIDDYAFSVSIGASSYLQNIVIPNSVISIGYMAFANCSGLTTVTIPSSVTSIGNYVFASCYGLTSVTIGTGVTSISENAFNSCSAMTSVTIPNTVTTIGNGAFSSCRSLTSITIPDSVTTIGDNAFSTCTRLSSITIPSSVTSIGNNAFDYCFGLTAITVNATTPPTLGSTPFDYTNNCPIYVPCESVNAYKTAWSAYASRITCLAPITYTASTKLNVALSAFTPNAIAETYDSATSAGTIEFSSTVTSIDYRAFYGRTNLTSIIIPNSVTSIGTSAFHNCSGLTSVTIPDSVTSIGNHSFQECSGITSVSIGTGCTSIGTQSFLRCTSLTSITIPDSVTSIEQSAFLGCTSLTSVTVEATTPPTLGSTPFATNSNYPIYVPSASVDTYKAASGWSTYASRIEPIS